MIRYAIGLDIGITSVGWVIVALDENDNPCGIIDIGCRIFPLAQHPKTGASLAAPRRAARSTRRIIRRRRHRKERIRYLLVENSVVSSEQLATLFDGELEDIYTLRVRALDELITGAEFARILIHLAQRRGFRSNRIHSSSKSDGEDGKLLDAIKENAARISDNCYRTVAEMYLKDPLFAESKHNQPKMYKATVHRDMVEDEVRKIFAAQRALNNSIATPEFEEAYLSILLSQRSFDEGPGGNSPYGGNQIRAKFGKCTFEMDEMRSPKAAYTFEYFTLLQKVNHIRLIRNGESIPLTQEQRQTLIELAHRKDSLSFSTIRKELAIADDYRFNCVSYYAKKAKGSTNPMTREDYEGKEKFNYLKAYHAMRKALDKVSKGLICKLTDTQRNAIASILTFNKTRENILAELRKEPDIPEIWYDAILSIGSFTKAGHLSVKACKKIIPYLEQGMKYNEACDAAGYGFTAHDKGSRGLFLRSDPEAFDSITSPVVRRAVTQTIKVINAIIRKQDCASPVYINIELARELAKSLDERREIEKENKANRLRNDAIVERLQNEFRISKPGGEDIQKFKLFEEQGEICPYSLKKIERARLFESGYAEIDHIIPYSISYDDAMSNKVLVLKKENQNKGKRLPMQYLTGARKEQFVVWVKANVHHNKKRDNLLKPTITAEDMEGFKERNLQDTKTASRFLMNYINDNLLFCPSVSGRNRKVNAVSGIITSYARKRWGINKVRADGDLHHAKDALVIACVTNKMIQEISRHNEYRECRYVQDEDSSFAVDDKTGEILKKFPHPWPGFRDEVEARFSSNPEQVVRDKRLPFYQAAGKGIELKPIFVSRAPNRKVTGEAHEATIRSPKLLNENQTVTKQPLDKLKVDSSGKIINLYRPGDDRLLVEALEARIKAFGGDVKKAFKDPFYKPKSDGSQGPLVKKVKLVDKSPLNVPLNQGAGVAEHSKLVRIDIFHIEDDGYYMVPLYVADTLKEELPNLACIAHKDVTKWKPMREEDFLFSLYPNDLVSVRNTSGIKLHKTNQMDTQNDSSDDVINTTNTQFMYYTGADRASASISLCTHDNSYEARIGIKTLSHLEKYAVDVLGNYHKVNKEVRLPFHRKKGS